jgi:hypothetical protein
VGSYEEYAVAVKAAVAHGLLVTFTQAGADLLA